MGRKKIPFQLLQSVEIGPAVAEGNCIARVENKVVFVKFAAPGDIADIKITGKKKKFLEGKIQNLIQPSPKRISAFCKHFQTCGGCKWQHLDYKDQLAFKQQQVVDSLERIGGISGFEVLPIIGSEKTQGYRNKLDLTFSNRAWITDFNPENPQDFNALGFHIPGKFDKVLDIEECYLMPEPLNEIHRKIKNYAEQNGLSFFDLRQQNGLLRNLILRCNSKGEWLVLVSFAEDNAEQISGLMNFIKGSFPQVVSLLYTINKKRNDTLADLEIIRFSGSDFLTEKLDELTFKIRPQSFFQTNTIQAEILYKVVRDFAELSGRGNVYDLYTGTGSIALFIASMAKHVSGIEYVPEAIADAEENMKLNGISNASFFAGNMKDILNDEFISIQGKPDIIITDPPRDGMHPDVTQKILETGAQRIVYVSCNPATQARDAKILEEKYRLVKIQPVDMFPHTHHVENVGLWLLKN